MEPRWLFPVLALAFGLAGLWRVVRNGRRDVAGRTWLLMAVFFGLVSIWLRSGGA